MSKILCINACSDNELSRTGRLSESFLDAYISCNPNDEITTRKLFDEKLEFLRREDYKKREEIPFKKDTKEKMYKYVKEFIEADKIVIAAPFKNMIFPAVLLAYIEHLSVADATYAVRDNGKLGLCTGKKVVYIAARGHYAGKYEYGEKYLRDLFATFGIKDFRSVIVEGLDIHKGASEALIQQGIKKLSNIAKVW